MGWVVSVIIDLHEFAQLKFKKEISRLVCRYSDGVAFLGPYIHPGHSSRGYRPRAYSSRDSERRCVAPEGPFRQSFTGSRKRDAVCFPKTRHISILDAGY